MEIVREIYHAPYRQENQENKGIEFGSYHPGYNEGDALHFDAESNLHKMMLPMAEYLLNIGNALNPNGIRYILDVGSGAGSLGYFLRQLSPNLKVFTLDGNQRSNTSPFVDEETHFIVQTDEPYKILDKEGKTVKFDLICSFEHLEHIEDKKMRTFLKNIRSHSHDGTLFVGTASMVEYEDEEEKHFHCNVKSHSEWISYFVKQQDLLDGIIVLPLPEMLERMILFLAEAQSRSRWSKLLAATTRGKTAEDAEAYAAPDPTAKQLIEEITSGASPFGKMVITQLMLKFIVAGIESSYLNNVENILEPWTHRFHTSSLMFLTLRDEGSDLPMNWWDTDAK